MREWIEPEGLEAPGELRGAVGGHPLVARTLARRGFTSVEAARAFLDPNQYRSAAPTDLPNLEKAVERLESAIREGETVCVWGDFDVDGQTATTALVSTFEDLGGRVRYHIPNRHRESHGVNLPVLKKLLREGVSLLLTCDTGVRAHEPIADAQSRGVDVVVTDHHNLPPTLPEAYAVVNPKMLPEAHPLRELPGVGCAYKLVEELYARAGRPAEALQHLDLVALGIVADVAMQVRDTRYLLQRGLEALRRTERLGLQALMEIAELNKDWVTEEHIGFVLAPRLNALGRLADANPAVELLSTGDLARARILAHELEGLNARRKLLCDQVLQGAEAQIERDASLLEHAALVLSHPSWPAGVIGIVAGRLAERYGRPTVLISTPPGEPGRGSARSVEGCNITAALAAHGEMLGSFGGHPMAAGLTIDSQRIPDFRRALSRTVLDTLGQLELRPALQIAGYLSLGELSLDLVEQLERLAPFGPGNPPLTMASKGLSLQSHSTAGRNGEHLQLIVQDQEGITQRVIWWNGTGSPLPEGRFDLAYVLRATDYRGQRDVQVEWVEARLVEAPAVGLRAEPSAVHIVDYRRESSPQGVLERLDVEEGPIWSEAGHRKEVSGHDRYGLGPSRALVIWTTPPGPRELRAVLDRVSPETVYLFAVDPGLDRPKVFLERLGGLIKGAVRSEEGRMSIQKLAAATAQREATVRAGIAWLAARGHISVVSEEGDELRVAVGSGRATPGQSELAARLKALLEETAAFRAHFSRTPAEGVLGR